MSWGTIAATSIEQDDFDAAVTKAADTYKANLAANDFELDQSALDQITAATAAAKAVVVSGAVGAGLVNVQLSGHANPGHKPAKGYANDVVTVTVSCADPQPTS